MTLLNCEIIRTQNTISLFWPMILIFMWISAPGLLRAQPYTTFRIHDAGNLHMTVTNWGVIGNPFGYKEPETGHAAPGAQFPRGFEFEHLLMSSLWVGAIHGGDHRPDTVVTTGLDGYYWDEESRLTEFYPDAETAYDAFTTYSTDDTRSDHSSSANSVQSFVCEYTDTLLDPAFVNPEPISRRRHRPLPISVRQNSFVWPYGPLGNCIIIQYWISNIGAQPLRDMYVGMLSVPQVGTSYADEVVGYLSSIKGFANWDSETSVHTLWMADNDGDPIRGGWSETSVRTVLGMRFLGAGYSSCSETITPIRHSFNWWVTRGEPRKHWGPQQQPGDPSILGSYGPPLGDNQRYRFMANGEIDFDQFRSGEAGLYESDWIPPPAWNAGSPNPYALGANVKSLISVGPFGLPPGDSIPIGVAIFAGDSFHRDPENIRNLPREPNEYFANLNFHNLKERMIWAEWVYDNPDVDTDGDGCQGVALASGNCRDTLLFFEEYCIEYLDSLYCDTNTSIGLEYCDSTYFRGDGIPDLQAPPPPPAPKFEIRTEPHTVRLSWTGEEVETFVDPFSRRIDFEGYNVYMGNASRREDLVLIASWDLENFDRYHYIPEATPDPWIQDVHPLTRDEIAYGFGPDVVPERHYDKSHFYETPAGERFFFKPHGGNRGNNYMEAGEPTLNLIQQVCVDSVQNEFSNGWNHFGRYECVVENLLPSQSYYFAVTAFDDGFGGMDFETLETSTSSNIQLAYPTYSPEYVEENRLEVSVYPNPYKIDANYRGRGFEDPLKEGFKERERRIHFVNLPPECTIKIFSLDGDLIRQLHHPTSRFSDTPSHTAWDLITRNTQAVQSGIYLYTVESEWGTQVGKFVIIK